MVKGKHKGGLSGSEHIRRYHAENPGVSQADAIIGLRKQGIRVTAGLVSHVRSKEGLTEPKQKKRKGKRKAKAKLHRNSNMLDLTELKSARAFIKQCGGPDNAVEVVKKAVATIKTLQGILD